MALQATLDTLDGIDAALAAHYVQKDGKFHLDLQGAADKKSGDNSQNNQNSQNQDAGNTGNAADKGGNNMIPKSRFDQLNEQKKSAEAALKTVVDELINDIPEDMRDLVPAIAPADQIKWIRNAIQRGVFTKKADSGPDSRRPGGSRGSDFAGMSPQAIMATGYKTVKK